MEGSAWKAAHRRRPERRGPPTGKGHEERRMERLTKRKFRTRGSCKKNARSGENRMIHNFVSSYSSRPLAG